jgi:hypothetical protein
MAMADGGFFLFTRRSGGHIIARQFMMGRTYAANPGAAVALWGRYFLQRTISLCPSLLARIVTVERRLRVVEELEAVVNRTLKQLLQNLQRLNPRAASFRPLPQDYWTVIQ